VDRFVEKPDRETAARMVADGYLWNSGIFVWRASTFLAEIEAHTPEVHGALADAGDSIARFFASVQSVSVDVGVLQRSQRVMVLPGDFGWDDVGTWGALARVRECDPHGNALSGDVHATHATRNVVHARGGAVVLYGVSGPRRGRARRPHAGHHGGALRRPQDADRRVAADAPRPRVTALYLYDDARARAFEPFALTRPASELRAGAEITRRRLGARARRARRGLRRRRAPRGVLGARRAAGGAGRAPRGLDRRERALPPVTRAGRRRGRRAVWRCAGRVGRVRLAADLALDDARELRDGTADLEAYAAGDEAPRRSDGRWLDEVWSLVSTLTEQLADDLPILARGLALRPAARWARWRT
jgi:hypothetical protein